MVSKEERIPRRGGGQSRDAQKADLESLEDLLTKFQLSAEFGQELCKEKSQKMRNPDQKTNSMGLLGIWEYRSIKLKSRDPKGTSTTLTKSTYHI